MTFLLVFSLAALLSSLQAAHIPSEAFRGNAEPMDKPLRKSVEDLIGPMNLRKDEGLDEPCKTPQVFEGKYIVEGLEQNSKKFVESFSFDGDGKRIRILSSVIKGGREYLTNTLILANKKVMYTLDIYSGVCINMSYDKPWMPAGLPADASYYGTTRLGGLSVENQGLLIDFYEGETSKGSYFAGVTRNGCWGTITVFNSKNTGPTTITYMDLTPGINDTDVFIVPIQCLWRPSTP